MQTTLDLGYWRSARLNGVLRYHWKALGRTVLAVLAILLGVQLVSLVLPLVFSFRYPYAGVYADLALTLVVALVSAMVVANQSTRFLLRFGTSRFSVWLGNLLALFAGMAVLLLGTLLLSMLTGAFTLALSQVRPDQYTFEQLFGAMDGPALFGASLRDALQTLPANLLYTLEWTSIFYLLACCMRRNRALTLTVLIGVPMLLMILTLIPAVRHAVDVVTSEDQGRMMALGAQWVLILSRVMRFIQREWPTLQLLGALGSLPLSYLCMRSTPQP